MPEPMYFINFILDLRVGVISFNPAIKNPIVKTSNLGKARF